MEETLQSNIPGQQSNIEVTTPIAVEATQEMYVPSSTEKKRAVMMYLLIGIIVVAFNNQRKSEFEQFHLKQSLGWWASFLLLLVVTLVFMFIPFVRYLPIFLVLIMVVFLAIFAKRARDGKYSIAQENKLAIFVGLGEWIMTLFEVNKEEITPEVKN